MTDEYRHSVMKRMDTCGAFGGIYGFAFIGAAVYYIQHSAGFWEGVLGVLKAIVWPAFVLYKVFEMLKM